jgi:hypothetical protein
MDFQMANSHEPLQIINNYIYISASPTCTTSTFKGTLIPAKQEVKYLGLILDTKLTWAAHLKGLHAKLSHGIKQLKYILRSHTPLHIKKLLYTTIIKPMVIQLVSGHTAAPSGFLHPKRTLTRYQYYRTEYFA